MTIILGREKPVIDPFDLVASRGVSAPCRRFMLTFMDYTYRVGRRLLENVEKVSVYAPVRGAVKGRFRGVEVCVVKLYFGAAASAMALELLIAAGAREFVVVGEAGALHPSLRIGDILIPTWGVREEGTSYHYAPPSYTPRPDPKLVELLEEELKRIRRRGIRIVKGGVWTTDAVFRETRDKVERFSGMGVLGVEMEATALMTVAHYRGAMLTVVLSISDELYGDEWREGFRSRKLRRTERICVEAALSALASRRCVE